AGPAPMADNSPAASHATLRTEQNMTSSRLILLEAYRPDAGPRNLPWRHTAAAKPLAPFRALFRKWPCMRKVVRPLPSCPTCTSMRFVESPKACAHWHWFPRADTGMRKRRMRKTRLISILQMSILLLLLQGEVAPAATCSAKAPSDIVIAIDVGHVARQPSGGVCGEDGNCGWGETSARG